MEIEKLNSAEMTSMLIGDRPNTYTYTKVYTVYSYCSSSTMYRPWQSSCS